MLAVGAGKCVVILATGTGGADANAITEVLLQAAGSGPTAKLAPPNDAEVNPEESDQSEDEDDEDGEGEAGTGKRAPPVKWEALSAGKEKRGKGVERPNAAGPRVVLR